MSGRATCAECDPSTASTASVSSDLHKYHVACSCGNNVAPSTAGQYAECAPTGPSEPNAHKTERPPALPPRPPPRPRNNGFTGRTGETASTNQTNPTGPRKYVWLCLGMGLTSCLLGGLLLAAALILRSLTISLHHLETIPTPIPAIMLVLTGLCVISLARRRNRYSYLIKIVGACCLVCALTCVLVTITTTVIHMNRLQTLRQCLYRDDTKTCVCSSVIMENQNAPEDEGVKCVFEEVADCDAVHGSLYRCLSAIFGLSVVGVLVCICSAMLAYQLLSHERKKMYWEQLELRCRSLYRPSSNTQPARPHNQQTPVCGECCSQCRAAAAVNWDLQQRFWASGRIGNLYSPNPGTGRRVSPWSWFPWTRNSNQRVGGGSSGDSAYGFGNSPAGYWQLGPPPPYTPHHRYLHHHNVNSHIHHHHSHSPIHMSHGCPMINQPQPAYPNSLTPRGSVSDLENLNHHHHHQGSLRMGMCQMNQMHSPVRVLPCHDPAALLALSPGHFVPINDNERQSDDSIMHRVECHHQSNENLDEFVEKVEDAHQHTCQKHLQHQEPEMRIADTQGEENLAFQCEKQTPPRQGRGGESELYFADVSSCCNVSLKTVEYCAGLVGTIEAQPDTSSGDSDVGSCPGFKGRPMRPRSHLEVDAPSPRINQRWKHQSPSTSSPNRTKKKPHFQCKSNVHYQDGCIDCNESSPSSSGMELIRSSVRMKSSPNRPVGDLHDIGIPVKRKPIEESMIVNDLNSIKCSDDEPNMVPSPLRRKAIEDALNKDENSKLIRRKPLDESMISSDSNSEEPFIMNDASIISLRRTKVDNLLNNSIEQNDIPMRRKSIEDSLSAKRKGIDDPMLSGELDDSIGPLRMRMLDETMIFNQPEVVSKLNLAHMMQHNARYSNDFNDGLNEPSLVTEAEGSRRGIVGSVCIAPDLRYEPVQPESSGNNHMAPVHMRCYSDSNTMDSGWQSGSEKHATD